MLIDWQGELVLIGTGLGDAESGPVPLVRSVGSPVLSLGSAVDTRGAAAPRKGSAVVDRGSRAFDRDQAGRWPQQVQMIAAR